MKQSIDRLQYLCTHIPPILAAFSNEEFSHKPASNKWSRKEILGHLIDSATNNHHRFIRGQFEDIPSIKYDQDKWNAAGHYNEIDTAQLIHLWTAYNLQLAELVKHLPADMLQRQCNTGENNHTLEWLFDDYVAHLEHHLHQITDYE